MLKQKLLCTKTLGTVGLTRPSTVLKHKISGVYGCLHLPYCFYYANVFIGSLPIHYLSVVQDMKLGCQTQGTVFNFCYTGWV